MGWRSIIITQHAKLAYSSRTMIVQTNDGINQIPIDDISLLLISTTQAVITTALISELSKKNVKIIFTDDAHEPISKNYGHYPNHRSAELLREQLNWEIGRSQVLWTKVVASKLINQINVLKLQNIKTSSLENELNKLELNDITNREAVIARKYFPLLFEDGFSRRNGSVINTALNYGYSILLSTINQEIVSNGYLTYIGIHHDNEENQFNLASDLMEPFRPNVDFWLANKKFNEFTPDVKYGLVELLSLEIKYNGKNTLLRNAITVHVRNCLKYLANKEQNIKIEMELLDEVPNHAINDNV
ncbi:type II CRISPR-associated endonuclease Cas1 [Pediococcus pentosaceus]|uniref:type II CRISPR-associated endonuclease Cas1 n=1 Tax=Pediococcus pentosaceus TaxID=1255 RepID=UPI00190C1CF1|nr:type II CRISPR-associated endonuclease Cas1 [Pediococcus pentosaceus]MBF7125035.1 type II CRISPR-associated endonuclease Cas1 [Pediococcus pentosaceus]WPK17013.1 type II CRISPR-associated endonuclease Cas1 [Pediococcus pentosaceus]